MSKKLAIKGHPTRGKEVIEILEMMGGKNIYKLLGNDRYAYCVIEGWRNEIRVGEYIFGDENMCFFTLEEFLEKYPFKVGDKVVYTKYGDNCDDYPVIIESMKWTGSTIEYTFDDCVTCFAKDLKMWNGEPNTVISGIYLNSCDYADEVELNLGDYEIEVRGNKTYAVKKKPKYPKTYKECRAILNYMIGSMSGYKSSLLASLQDLLVCRDAYWKIAGEEMGLGKPWEPKSTEMSHAIVCRDDGEFLLHRRTRAILIFPTIEMRNTFYENFKDLIERCEELL